MCERSNIVRMIWSWKRKRTMVAMLLVSTSPLLLTVDCYSIRPATEVEVTLARKILFQQAMNPFSLSADALLVACEDSGGDEENTGVLPILGFGQIRSLDDEWSELASLYVIPERRNEKIGGAIVRALVNRHCAEEQQQISKVCLLTLQPTVRFYEPFGFRIANNAEREQLPKAIQLEFNAGRALSFVLGNDLVCMVKTDS